MQDNETVNGTKSDDAAERRAEARAVRNAALKAEMNDLAVYLSKFGRYIIMIFVGVAKRLAKGTAKLAAYIWKRSENLVTALMKRIGYLLVLIMSPFVKVHHALRRARSDIRENRVSKGFGAALKIAFTHLGEFIFGSTGVMVTLFNIAAPVVSVLFLFNIVSYASNLNYCVKLTVNDKLLGYVENEQVYYDADEILKERINYLGSDESIRLEPEFSIELAGTSPLLTKYQVADMILEYSDIKVEYAYGFYLNGIFQGAVPDNAPIAEALDGLIEKYRAAHPNADVSFRDTLEYSTAGLYLSGSIIDTDWLVSQLTSVKANAGYYIAEEGDTLSGICDKVGISLHQAQLMNPDIGDGELSAGDHVKIRDEIPFLSVNVSVVEDYDTTVAYSTEYYNDDSLYNGVTRTTTSGVNGTNHITASVTYVNNIETSRRITHATVVSAPVTERIAVGTKVPPEQYSSADAGYGKFIWPMEVGKSHVSELTYWDGGYAGHVGIDIVQAYGAPIYAGGSGTVLLSGWNYGYGNCVIIDHGNGYQTLYGHCSELLVSVGEQVIQGQMIAKEGSSGYVTGPHLHFEVRMGSVKLNPINYLENVYYG
ncbi:MAG: peptidoglycan DD-metalloendopeptidase family protein [Ruminiclostridium sp.]|nr:peptidoglycan DD-metalloendopeptidase family protein [Ruminiclostridium sp.]